MLAAQAPGGNQFLAASLSGYRTFLAQGNLAQQVVSNIAASYGAKRRMRFSHDAHPQDESRGLTWGGDWSRWGGRHVPMPANRGIPFRGDCFGSIYYAAASLGSTGA